MGKKIHRLSLIERLNPYRLGFVYAIITLLMINYTVVTILMRDFFIMKVMRDILLILLLGACMPLDKIKRFPGFGAIILFALWCMIALLRAAGLSLGVVFLRRYLFPLLLFGALMQMDLENNRIRLQRFVLVLFAILSAWGIFQAHVLGDQFLMSIGYPHFYADHYGRDIIANSYYFGGLGIQRVVSTLCNPNVLALILGSTLIFLMLSFSLFTRKKIAGVLLGIIAVAYILTVSRSNFLAMGVVVLLFALPYIPYKKYVFTGLGGLIVLLVIIGLIQGEGSLLYRLIQFVVESFSFTESSAAGRSSRWLAALEGTLQNPFGVGFGHVGALAWESGVRDLYFSSENSYFALALDTGWLGLVTYLVFVGIQVVRLLRYTKIFKRNGDKENEKFCMAGLMICAYFLLVFLFSNHIHDLEAMAIIFFYIAIILSVAKKNLPEAEPAWCPKGIMGKLYRKVNMLLDNLWMAICSLFWKRERNTVLFGAWFGDKFADNSRFLFQYLAENKRKLRLKHVVWVTRNESVKDMLCNMGYEAYMMDSPESIHFHKTAFMHVICNSASDRNGTIPDIDIRYSFGAKRVNLWHGVGVVKGVGCASKEYQRRKAQHKLLYTIKEGLEHIKLYRKFVTGTGGWGDFYFLSPTETDTMQFAQFSYVPQNRFIESQYPRTCPCVRLTPREQEVLEYLKKFDKIVMYLPTFRTGDNKFDFSNLAQQLEKTLAQENAIWVQKAHSASATALSLQQQGNILNLEPAFDINTLMPHCDLLVTDYSSAASDARFFQKPVLFYVPDLEAYTNGDNGITPEAEELMRGPQLFDVESLRDSLVKTLQNPEWAKPADYADIRWKYWGEGKDYSQIWKEICDAVGK